MEKKLSPKVFLLGIQHLFAMFGATVLVPRLTGMNASVALVTAGIGTLIFHLCTKRKVPVFVGSSFAFIPVIQALTVKEVVDGQMVYDTSKIPLAQGGIIVAGLIYVALAALIYFVGVERVQRLFPPIVTGPVIVVIGLTLAPTAIDMAKTNWLIAIITLAVVIVMNVFAKNFFKLVPILIGIVVGYLACIVHDLVFPGNPLVDLTAIVQAPWVAPVFDFSGSFFTLPQFDLNAILLIAPVAFVTFMEHIGDITTNGSVVGQNFIKDPGLHRTLLGDGLATAAAGLLGGPANTTYSENTGVLAVTKVYDPFILRIAAVFAIILGLFGKFGAVLQTIPSAVMGGVSILLFGIIASVGMRTITEANLDYSKSRNLVVVALILVIGIGLSDGVELFGIKVSGLFLCVVVGALVNKILPQNAE